MITTPDGVKDISADELRELMASTRENRFALIDVRQPEEYTQAHIPGARLVPLMEVEADPEQIEAAEHTIFYCRSGGRSMRAAIRVVHARGLDNVYNLAGGMLGWNGDSLPDVPNIQVFDLSGPLDQILLRAIELERGADLLYERLLSHFRGSAVEPILERLVGAEEAHGRALHHTLRVVAPDEPRSFEEIFSAARGDILESGETFDAVWSRLNGSPQTDASLLELALEMELKAYDLYRNIAEGSDSAELRAILFDLAAQERQHVQLVLDGLGSLAA